MVRPEGMQRLVSEFHRKYGYPHEDFPQTDVSSRLFRLRLIAEEYAELVSAFTHGNDSDIADALADLAYVIYGTAVTFNYPLDRLIREVHKSNMTKEMDRKLGKPVKGRWFVPPDIPKVLKDADEL